MDYWKAGLIIGVFLAIIGAAAIVPTGFFGKSGLATLPEGASLAPYTARSAGASYFGQQAEALEAIKSEDKVFAELKTNEEYPEAVLETEHAAPLNDNDQILSAQMEIKWQAGWKPWERPAAVQVPQGPEEVPPEGNVSVPSDQNAFPSDQNIQIPSDQNALPPDQNTQSPSDLNATAQQDQNTAQAGDQNAPATGAAVPQADQNAGTPSDQNSVSGDQNAGLEGKGKSGEELFFQAEEEPKAKAQVYLWDGRAYIAVPGCVMFSPSDYSTTQCDIKDIAGSPEKARQLKARIVLSNRSGETEMQIDSIAYSIAYIPAPPSATASATLQVFEDGSWFNVPGCIEMQVPQNQQEIKCNAIGIISTRERAQSVRARLAVKNQSGSATTYVDEIKLGIDYSYPQPLEGLPIEIDQNREKQELPPEIEDKNKPLEEKPVVGEEEFEVRVVSSSGELVGASVRFYDESGRLVPKPEKGASYTARLAFPSGSVASMEIKDLNIDQNVITLGVDDVNVQNISAPPGVEFVNAFAINPEGLDFNSATVTGTADANELYKCRDWDYNTETCMGSWELVQTVAPGQEYSIAIGQNDPGFAFGKPAGLAKRLRMKKAREQFKSSETPEFEVDLTDDQNRAADANINAYLVYAPTNETISLDSSAIKRRAKGKYALEISKRSFRAGLYKVVTEIDDNGKKVQQVDWFKWGLIAVNTYKSTYKPGEGAEFEIVVLDNLSYGACGPGLEVTMTIAEPSGSVFAYTKSGGQILQANQCGVFIARHATSAEGTYLVSARAVDAANSIDSAIDTNFLVASNYDFEIVRQTATKIDPDRDPQLVSVDITPQIAAGNYSVVERVPAELEITGDGTNPEPTVQKIGDEKVLTWKNLASSGTSRIGYLYDTPGIKPWLYYIGPIEIQHDGTSYFEARSWQIAVDANPTTKLWFRLAADANVAEPSPNAPSGTGPYAVAGATNWAIGGLSDTAGATTQTALLSTNPGGTTDVNMMTFVSPPLTAQTIASGTWKTKFDANEAATAANLRVGFEVMRWSDSNDAKAQTILGPTLIGAELGTSLTGVFASGTGSAATFQKGDKIVVETFFDCSGSCGSGTNRAGKMQFGGSTNNTNDSNTMPPASVTFAGSPSVNITNPSADSNSSVEAGTNFLVTAPVACKYYNCGTVDANLMYCSGAGCTNFTRVNSSGSTLTTSSIVNPSAALNAGASNTFSWVVITSTGGDYELRVDINGTTSDNNMTSGSDRTMTISTPQGALTPTITTPAGDNTNYSLEKQFDVNGTVSCATASCGGVSTKIQWCPGAGCSNWTDLNTSPGGPMQIIYGDTQRNIGALGAGVSYDVNWGLKGFTSGTYELLIVTVGTSAPLATTNGTGSTIVLNQGTLTQTVYHPSIDGNWYYRNSIIPADLKLSCSNYNCSTVDTNVQFCNATGGACATFFDLNFNPANELYINFGGAQPQSGTIDAGQNYDANWLLLGSKDGRYELRFRSADKNAISPTTTNGTSQTIDVNYGKIIPMLTIPTADNNVGDVGENFLVSGTVYCNSDNNFTANCGTVDTNIQYCKGAGCTTFFDLNSTSGELKIISGAQDQASSVNKGSSYNVSWTLQSTIGGTYELRLHSVASTADTNNSIGNDRTITHAGPPVVYNGTTIKVDNALSGYLGNKNSQSKDQNHGIQFQIYDVDSNYLYAKAYYSATKGARTNLVIDLNLSAIKGITNADYNCSGGFPGLDWRSPVTCFLDWNIASAADGNYFIDINGYGSAGRNDTNSSNLSFMVDKTDPATSDDRNVGWQRTDANIHLNATETGSGTALTQYRIDLGAWTTYDKNILFNSDGNRRLDYNSTDRAGNAEATKSAWIAVDKTSPATSDNHVDGWSTGTSITLSCGDGSGSGCSTTKYKVDSNALGWVSGTTVVFNSDGNHQVDYNSTDAAGNIESTHTIWVAKDNIAPSTTDNHANGWSQNAAKSITLTCTDTNSGCANIKYRVDQNNSMATVAGASATVVFNSDGNHRVDYNAIDGAGNQEANHVIWAAIDNSAPSTTDDHANGWSSGTSVSLNCTDTNSGCQTTYYWVDQNNNGVQATGTAIVFNSDGNHRVDYNSKDNAGNQEANHVIWAAKENTAPTTSDDHNAGWQNLDANVHLTCNDGSGSGCAITKYRIDLGAWTTYDKNILFNSDGNKRLDYNSTDSAGNIEAVKSVWVAVNKPPTISAIASDNNQARYGATITFTGTCSDAGSGNYQKLVVCKTNEDCQGVPANQYCSGSLSSTTSPTCSWASSCTDVGANKVAWAECVDGNSAASSPLLPKTFDVNDAFTFASFFPAQSDSNRLCQANTFGVNSVLNCSGSAVTDANVVVRNSAGLELCDDASGPSGNYSCSIPAQPIGDLSWHIDINRANYDSNRTADRNFGVSLNLFSVGIVKPDNNYFGGGSGALVDFNVSDLNNSCTQNVNDATVTFREATQNLPICADASGASGYYSCTGTAGTAPLAGNNNTWDFNITRSQFENYYFGSDRNLGLQLTDLTFTINYPSSGCQQFKGCSTVSCSACTYAYYEDTNLQGGDANQVAPYGQTSGLGGIAFFAYDNQSASTLHTWQMDLNAALDTARLRNKVSTAYSGYQGECSGNPATGCAYVEGTSLVTIATGIGWSQANDRNGFAWADFIGALPSHSASRDLNSTSSSG